MILTTKGRYAVKAIIDLLDETQPPNQVKAVSLLSISKRQNISLSYLEQIFANLRKAEIVYSIKGPGGGYLLKRKPEEVTIFQIIAATGEQIRATCGNGKEGCVVADKITKKTCKAHHLWGGLEKNINDYLNSVSLANFCNQ